MRLAVVPDPSDWRVIGKTAAATDCVICIESMYLERARKFSYKDRFGTLFEMQSICTMFEFE